MNKLVWFSLIWFGFCSVACGDEPGEALFVRRVHPMLVQKCWACHGNDPQEIAGGLDLRSLATWQAGGDSGKAVVVAGQPEASPVYLAASRSHDEWSAMPPKDSERLDEEQLQSLGEWIKAGAPWPGPERFTAIMLEHGATWSDDDGVVLPSDGALSPEWANRRYKLDGLWAFVPVVKPDLPKMRVEGSSTHPVDVLIAARLPSDLPLAPQAAARALIRRATFDLTGLPPSPSEVEDFERNFATNQDAAIESLVDRLLASPHYGERMAQHWLDVTRYADSSGFANDYERGNAWRYRDYVVRSFNTDKPYDQFIREQIAGDEIDPANPELIVATGFLRMGPWELTGMEVAKVARQRFLDDVTNIVGETFLAQSLQCARCHDHKFDPIPTHDYYAIQACFATTQLSERAAPFIAEENTSGFTERDYLEAARVEHNESLKRLDQQLLQNAQAWYAAQTLDQEPWKTIVAKEQAAVGTNPRVGEDYREVFPIARYTLMNQGVPESQLPPNHVGFSPAEFGAQRVAKKGLERLRWELDRYEPFALAVYNGLTPSLNGVYAPLRMPNDRLQNGEHEQTAILAGGDPFSPTVKVQPGVLSVVENINQLPGVVPHDLENRRAALADWIASPKNPLTSRAIVNRIWLWHFGQPIAGNPNNFGSTGQKPTHPELLDWMAATFVEQGWSFKKLHRLIMTSQAYRRSGVHPQSQVLRERDPHNHSYAVFQPRRLSAEELRDAMLVATGELNRTIGGIPNRPEINLESAMQPRQVMGAFAAAWVPNPLPQQRHRRSLYALKLRGLLDPQMEVFNAPTPDFSCERRDVSTVTPQVFSLFNSQNSHSRALALAHRVLQESHGDEEAITRLFLLLYLRSPAPRELQACLDHWRDTIPLVEEVSAAQRPPLEIIREAVEENTGETFTFRETLYSNQDYVPDLQPADVDARTRALADVCLVLFNSNEFVYVY